MLFLVDSKAPQGVVTLIVIDLHIYIYVYVR